VLVIVGRPHHHRTAVAGQPDGRAIDAVVQLTAPRRCPRKKAWGSVSAHAQPDGALKFVAVNIRAACTNDALQEAAMALKMHTAKQSIVSEQDSVDWPAVRRQILSSRTRTEYHQ